MKFNVLLQFVLPLIAIFLFNSCDMSSQNQSLSTFFLYAILFLLLLGTLWFINKRRKRAKNENSSVSKFNNSIQTILAKLDTPEEKIQALLYALDKVEANEEYDKNRAWKNSLLITIYLHMTVAYNEQENDRMVLDTCNNILDLNPKHALTYYNRGYIYYKTSQSEEAKSDFSKYLSLDTSNKWGVKEDAEKMLSEINGKV